MRQMFPLPRAGTLEEQEGARDTSEYSSSTTVRGVPSNHAEAALAIRQANWPAAQRG